MPERYKVTGINPGDNGFQLGNCLTMRRSRDVVNTPDMYRKVRGSFLSWRRPRGAIDDLLFFDALFSSDVHLDYVVPEHSQPGDAAEGALLVAGLLVAFPDARFGIGLQGGKKSLSPMGHYRSFGTTSVDLSDGSEGGKFLTELFDYLRKHSYWVDDDLVHMLALLTDLSQDRDRTIHGQVLSLSTSGNHRVDAGLFHAYQVVEALLGMGDREPLDRAITRWNNTYALQLKADEIRFIKNLRDTALHFKPERAQERLEENIRALGFDGDRSRRERFRSHGIQKLLRQVAQAYFMQCL